MEVGVQFERIIVKPGKCGGKPRVRNMRITARRVLELLATYPDWPSLLAEYPYLETEDLRQVLGYTAASPETEFLTSFSLERPACGADSDRSDRNRHRCKPAEARRRGPRRSSCNRRN